MWQGSKPTSWWAKQDFDYSNTGHRGTHRCDPTDWWHLWIKFSRTNKYPNPNSNLEDWLVFLTEAHQRRDTSVWGHTGVTSAIRIKCVCCDGNWSSVAVVICIRPRGLTFTWWGCRGLCERHKPAELAHSYLLCSCVYFCLYVPFNYFSFHKSSRQLSVFSLCSSGLNFALLVL